MKLYKFTATIEAESEEDLQEKIKSISAANAIFEIKNVTCDCGCYDGCCWGQCDCHQATGYLTTVNGR